MLLLVILSRIWVVHEIAIRGIALVVLLLLTLHLLALVRICEDWLRESGGSRWIGVAVVGTEALIAKVEV